MVQDNKKAIRKNCVKLAILQIIKNDKEEFQKRVARQMADLGYAPGNRMAESLLAMDEFVNSL